MCGVSHRRQHGEINNNVDGPEKTSISPQLRDYSPDVHGATGTDIAFDPIAICARVSLIIAAVEMLELVESGAVHFILSRFQNCASQA